MAASDPHLRFNRLPPREGEGVATGSLHARLEEEISRAERHGTELSCLLVVIENLDEMTREHGSELREQTLEYVAGALRRELRRFDRIGRASWGGRDDDGDLLIILPGADSPRAEIVARRALERMRTIKVEARGERWPLRVSIGLAAWQAEMSAEMLLAQTRAAMRCVNGEDHAPRPESVAPLQVDDSQPAQQGAGGSLPPALGSAGRS